MVDPAAYFERLGTDGRFRPTAHTGGAWSQSEQHISPMTGLVVHEIERLLPSDLLVSRISLDILGTIPIEEFTVEVDVVRPGRTIELVGATVTHAGRTVALARVWRLAEADTTAVEGGAGDPMPADLPPWDMSTAWPGGYIASLDVRRDPAAAPGRARAWIASALELVAGEPSSTVARFAMLLDTANGIGVRADTSQWLFPNVDLTAHLHRQPQPGPLGLDTTVTFGPTGQGLTSSTLHDVAGPVGRAAQVLTVRPLGPPTPHPR